MGRSAAAGRMREAVGMAAVLGGGMLAAVAPPAWAGPDPSAGDIAARVLACTVGISCTVDGGSCTGTGIVISPEGHILTASSVVPPGATRIATLFPGWVRRPAALVAVDDALSAAIIKVDVRDLPFLSLAGGIPAVGSVAYTAGDVSGAMLSGGRASLSRGSVSGVYPVARRGAAAYAGTVIETTAAVNPGCDGGPLVDAVGNVCGVVTLGLSPLRWQGVAVPTAVLRERFATLAAAGVATFVAPAEDGRQPAVGFSRGVAEILPALVGIEVERTWKPELLPSVSWEEHRGGIDGWDALPAPEQGRRLSAFLGMSRAFEVNQLLRRPPGAVTGIVISDEGHVLTSTFNVAADTAFVAKKTGQPPVFNGRDPLDKQAAPPDGGVEPRPNAVARIMVVLPDGSRREARLHARHEPLGIALVKTDARGLTPVDLAGLASAPQVGDAVAVVGWLAGGTPAHTLNPGIVSAPARNRGYQFQTDALLNYGNSGGPVVDGAGRFLGIATAPIEPDTVLGRILSLPEAARWARAPNSGVGMVARADRIEAVLAALVAGRSFERIPGPFLGLAPDQARALGDDVIVGGVQPGSPAAAAGIRTGDRLVAYNGVELRDWRDLTERVAAGRAGDEVVLSVQRPGGGPRLVIAGRDVESAADLERLRKSLQPGETFEGMLTADDTREIRVVLAENK